MNKRFLVGSHAFFDNIKGFHSKDYDYLELIQDPKGFKQYKEQHLRGVCTFSYKLKLASEMIQDVINNSDALQIGKFLVPEVVEELGMTVADILPLEPLLQKLDKEHQYYKVIFEAIKSNNSFTLTDEQITQAYQIYKEARE